MGYGMTGVYVKATLEIIYSFCCWLLLGS